MSAMSAMSDTRNWPLKGDQLERQKHILDTGFLSDAVLVLGNEKKELKVHRVLLEMSSPVFFKDFQQSVNNQIVLRDVDAKVFILMVEYVYLGKCGAKPEECFPLLKLASRYGIQNLTDFCTKSLKEGITNENVTNLFQQAMEFEHEDLIKLTLTHFCSIAADIVNSGEFAELRPKCLYEILRRDDLRVTNELQIFNAVMRWGEAECCRRQKLDSNEPNDIRKVLHEVLGLIRFPVMEAEEFILNVAIRNVFEDKELIPLLIFFNMSSGNRARASTGRFNAAPRKYKAAGVPSLSSTIYSAPRLLKGLKCSYGMYLSETEILEFKTNRAVVLVGLKTFHSATLIESDYLLFTRSPASPVYDHLTISVEIVLRGNSLLRQVKKFYNLLESGINFDTPVNVEANSWYTIVVSTTGILKGERLSVNPFRGPNTCEKICNVKCEEETVVHNVGFEFRRGKGNGEDLPVPIEHGIIQEFLFQTHFDKMAFHKQEDIKDKQLDLKDKQGESKVGRKRKQTFH